MNIAVEGMAALMQAGLNEFGARRISNWPSTCQHANLVPTSDAFANDDVHVLKKIGGESERRIKMLEPHSGAPIHMRKISLDRVIELLELYRESKTRVKIRRRRCGRPGHRDARARLQGRRSREHDAAGSGRRRLQHLAQDAQRCLRLTLTVQLDNFEQSHDILGCAFGAAHPSIAGELVNVDRARPPSSQRA